MKILFLSRWFPFPPDNGARIRIFNLLKILAGRHEVDLVSFAGRNPTAVDPGRLRELCRKVTLVPYTDFDPDSMSSVSGFLSRTPRSVIATFSKSMQESVNEAWRTRSHDLVIASALDMAPYARHLEGGLKVLEEVELTSLWDQIAKERRPIQRVRRSLMWWKLAGYLRGLLQDFDACTVVSEQEKDRLRSLGPMAGAVEVIPNGVDPDLLKLDFGPPRPSTLVYSGSVTYSANFEAVDYFVREILPLVRQARPDVTLYVTGSTEGVPTERLERGEAVRFTGYLKDIRPTVGAAWISVVPLLSGGGTRLKVLESMALGTPVISTSKGVEGLEIQPGREFVQADTAETFAKCVIDLLNDSQARSELAENGRNAVAERYGWPKVGEKTLGMLDRLRARDGSRTFARLSHAT